MLLSVDMVESSARSAKNPCPKVENKRVLCDVPVSRSTACEEPARRCPECETVRQSIRSPWVMGWSGEVSGAVKVELWVVLNTGQASEAEMDMNKTEKKGTAIRTKVRLK